MNKNGQDDNTVNNNDDDDEEVRDGDGDAAAAKSLPKASKNKNAQALRPRIQTPFRRAVEPSTELGQSSPDLGLSPRANRNRNNNCQGTPTNTGGVSGTPATATEPGQDQISTTNRQLFPGANVSVSLPCPAYLLDFFAKFPEVHEIIVRKQLANL